MANISEDRSTFVCEDIGDSPRDGNNVASAVDNIETEEDDAGTAADEEGISSTTDDVWNGSAVDESSKTGFDGILLVVDAEDPLSAPDEAGVNSLPKDDDNESNTDSTDDTIQEDATGDDDSASPAAEDENNVSSVKEYVFCITSEESGANSVSVEKGNISSTGDGVASTIEENRSNSVADGEDGSSSAVEDGRVCFVKSENISDARASSADKDDGNGFTDVDFDVVSLIGEC